jgi:hypothetical protein
MQKAAARMKRTATILGDAIKGAAAESISHTAGGRLATRIRNGQKQQQPTLTSKQKQEAAQFIQGGI